ncbi:hypothetical protein [Saccharicrinis sp. FJH54]|uniref:hypothetical protein n=1 Tax=Saccharicrinis sp. FJH54 TaxID=3344665 RepID=UPI0035D52324
MDLEDLKLKWNDQEKKLDKVLRFNRELFLQLNLEKSGKNIRKPLITEIISLVIMIGTIVLITILSLNQFKSPQFSITGFVAVTLSTVYLFFSVRRYRMLAGINFYNSDIISLQKELTILNSFILRARKTELALLPFFTIALMPVVFIELAGIDLYRNLVMFGIEIVIILTVGYLVGAWINRKVYDEKIHKAAELLKEIRSYEAE